MTSRPDADPRRSRADRHGRASGRRPDARPRQAGFLLGGRPGATPHLSAGRFPDGHDADSNCSDFRVQAFASLAAAPPAGATNIKVSSVDGFAAGQKITIDAAGSRETAVVAGTDFRFNGPGTPPTMSVPFTRPVAKAHAPGVQVSGSGITLTTALTRAHRSGAPLVNGVPTPGAANRYQESR